MDVRDITHAHLLILALLGIVVSLCFKIAVNCIQSWGSKEKMAVLPTLNAVLLIASPWCSLFQFSTKRPMKTQRSITKHGLLNTGAMSQQPPKS